MTKAIEVPEYEDMFDIEEDAARSGAGAGQAEPQDVACGFECNARCAVDTSRNRAILSLSAVAHFVHSFEQA